MIEFWGGVCEGGEGGLTLDEYLCLWKSKNYNFNQFNQERAPLGKVRNVSLGRGKLTNDYVVSKVFRGLPRLGFTDSCWILHVNGTEEKLPNSEYNICIC